VKKDNIDQIAFKKRKAGVSAASSNKINNKPRIFQDSSTPKKPL
jgi:hypothetical protein